MLLEVGRITKTHGVRGDVLVLLTTERTERVAPGTVLHTDRGELTVGDQRFPSGFDCDYGLGSSRKLGLCSSQFSFDLTTFTLAASPADSDAVITTGCGR
jgi:hypothetical protein